MRRKAIPLLAAVTILGMLSAGLPAAAQPPPIRPIHPTGALHDARIVVRPHRVPGLVAKGAPTALPSSLDLSAWAAPVGDQGAIGSCVSWAISYGMNGWSSRYKNLEPGGVTFAPMYTYSQVHASDGPDGGGAFPSDVYGVGQLQGTDTRSGYWQGDFDFRTLPTDLERQSAASYKTGSFTYLYSGTPGPGAVDAIESTLAAYRPVALTIPVYSAFDRLNSTDYRLDASQVDPSTFRGNHEVLALGYDANGVLIQNSWGTWWGRSGYAYLNWNFIQTYSIEATVVPDGVYPTLHPSAPTAVTGTAGAGTATILWSPPLTDHSATVSSYTVSRDGNDRAGNGPRSVQVGASASSYAFADLVGGATYHLSVQATNSTGTGPAATVTVSISDISEPSAPTSVSTGAVGPGSATLRWSPPASDGGSAVTSYKVARDGVDTTGTGSFSQVLPASARVYTFSKLRGATTYHLSVNAANAKGGGPDVTVTIQTLPSRVPSVPTAVTAAAGKRAATLSWAPPVSENGSAVNAYQVGRDGAATKSVGARQWSTVLPASARSFTFTKLGAGAKYHLWVRARNGVGYGPRATVTVSIPRR